MLTLGLFTTSGTSAHTRFATSDNANRPVIIITFEIFMVFES
ncbi:hypothetical protein [Moraxella lacunata]